jgi:hypothetical protein
MKTDWNDFYNISLSEVGQPCSTIYAGIRTSIAMQVWPLVIFIWDSLYES